MTEDIAAQELQRVEAFLSRREPAAPARAEREASRIVLRSDAREHVRVFRRAADRWGADIDSLGEWFAIGVNDAYPTLDALLAQLPISYPHVLAPPAPARPPRPRVPAVPALTAFDDVLETLAGLDVTDLTSASLHATCVALGWTQEIASSSFVRYRISPSLSLDATPGEPHVPVAWVVLLAVGALGRGRAPVARGLPARLEGLRRALPRRARTHRARRADTVGGRHDLHRGKAGRGESDDARLEPRPGRDRVGADRAGPHDRAAPRAPRRGVAGAAVDVPG